METKRKADRKINKWTDRQTKMSKKKISSFKAGRDEE